MYSVLIAYILGLLTTVRNKDKGRDHRNQATNPSDSKALPDGPISVVCIPPPKSDEQKTADEKEKRRKTIKFWAEVAGVFVLLVYTAFTGYQACLMRTAANATVEFFRTDERAWVEIEPVKPIFFVARTKEVPRQVFRYEIYLRNVGKTPARDVVMKARSVGSTETFGSDKSTIDAMQDRIMRGNFTDSTTGKPMNVFGSPIPSVLAPNTVAPVAFVLTGQEPQIFATGHGFYDYLMGRIDYVDQFNIPHWMKFCFFVINQRGELRYCDYGNDEDRNAENK